MTRWARGGNANKKKPHEASSWEQLKQQFGKQTPRSDKVQKRHRSERDNLMLMQEARRKRTATNLRHPKTQAQKALIRVPGDKERATTSKGTKKVTTLISDQPGSSGKSIIDVLLEADKKTIGKKNGGEIDVSGVNDKEIALWGQSSLAVLQKKEKRSEDRRLKRQKKKADSMVCFHCRRPGHGVAECPQMLEDVEQGTGICFRCGSTEHDVNKCTAKVDKKLGEFPYAKCFICQQTGHLSRTCPDNPRGLYPEGGGCKECGSVEHRWWNCPIRKPVKEVNVSVSTLMVDKRAHTSADAEPAFIKKPKVKVKKSGPKIVIF